MAEETKEKTEEKQPTQEKKQPAQTESTPKPTPKKEKPEKTVVKKKKGWFQKIPTRVLLSPAGIILIFFAMVMEVVDWILIPVVDQLWELPLEILFIVLLTVLAKVPIKTSILPFLVERIPILSDILPTWVIRMIV